MTSSEPRTVRKPTREADAGPVPVTAHPAPAKPPGPADAPRPEKPGASGDHTAGLASLGMGGLLLAGGVGALGLGATLAGITATAGGGLLVLFGTGVMLLPEPGRVTLGSTGLALGALALLANVFAPGLLPALAAAAAVALLMVQAATSASRLLLWRLHHADARLLTESSYAEREAREDLFDANRWLQTRRPPHPKTMRSVNLRVEDEWKEPLEGNFKQLGPKAVKLPPTSGANDLRAARTGTRTAVTKGVRADVDALRNLQVPPTRPGVLRIRTRGRDH